MSNRFISQSATHLLNLLVSTKDRGVADHIRWTVLAALRRFLLRFDDPTVEYTFCGTMLRIPLSHDLPIIRRSFPYYSDNVGRIAGYLAKRFGQFPIIDIGANVGDTVAIIHQYAHLPILCIEGEPKFAELLSMNIASANPCPIIEPTFVGTSDNIVTVVVHHGTARLANTTSGSGVRTRRFKEILKEHSAFQNSQMLKIDTDGMDIAILNSALDWISQQKPVLFFEYDPDLQHTHRDGGLELLAKLKGAGYHRVLVYENIGDYMLSAELENEALLSDLHEFFSGRKSKRYCDLCIFHHEIDDLAVTIRQSELEFFRAARASRALLHQ